MNKISSFHSKQKLKTIIRLFRATLHIRYSSLRKRENGWYGKPAQVHRSKANRPPATAKETGTTLTTAAPVCEEPEADAVAEACEDEPEPEPEPEAEDPVAEAEVEKEEEEEVFFCSTPGQSKIHFCILSCASEPAVKSSG